MTIEQAARKLRSREVSAVELATESLRVIHEQQPRLNAFITITDEVALEQARRADDDFAHGIDHGPLQGIPYALKDLFNTAGIRTTGGTKIFADHVPDQDCAVYEKLRAAGAVLMGKTGLHELAYGITSNNPHFGAVRKSTRSFPQPGRFERRFGCGRCHRHGLYGHGQRYRRIDSHSGGAYCGCVGFKPTFGRVSRFGSNAAGRQPGPHGSDDPDVTRRGAGDERHRGVRPAG